MPLFLPYDWEYERSRDSLGASQKLEGWVSRGWWAKVLDVEWDDDMRPVLGGVCGPFQRI